MRRKTIHQAVYQGFDDRWMIIFFHIQGDRCWCHTSSLLMGNCCLWGGLNCGTCRFPHPPSNLSPAIHCYWTSDAWQVTSRELGMYIGDDLDWKNREACGDSLMNGHWEELIGKVEELLHATDHPDNYLMHIQYIILYTSDGLQRLKAFLSCTWESVCRAWSRRWLCIGPCR